MRGRRRSPWPRVRAETLTAALEAGGKTLDAGQLETVRLLTSRQFRGVYLHGGVGRGKTWISGRFFDAAEVEAGVLLTSNYPPADLLPNPLFHHHLEPVIALIQEQLTVRQVPDGIDYRPLSRGADRGFAAGTWTAVDTATQAPGPEGEGTGRGGADGTGPASGASVPAGASVPVGASGTRRLRVACADPAQGILTATFAQLCEQPVSVHDYLGLAQEYDHWRLLGVPAPEGIDDQPFQRFAFLVDVLVDADLRLDVTAALPMGEWTAPGRFPRDADRFLSRLSLLGAGMRGRTDEPTP